MSDVEFGDPRLPERFWNKVEKQESGCWEWVGAISKNGYSAYQHNKRQTSGHRASHMVFIGEIPEGYHVDHLCRIRACVNPAHLEAVTPRTNLLRGDTHAARNVLATHCPKGHEYSPENTRILRSKSRCCRKCSNEWQRRNGARVREEAKRRGARWAS